MDTNGYLVCNGGGLVFCSVVDVGGGERELWTSCTLTHTRTHTYTHTHTKCTHTPVIHNINNNNNDNSNNNTTTTSTEYDNNITQQITTTHFLFDHPHFFPVAMKARSTTMSLPPPQKTPACVYYYYFFFFFFVFLFFLFIFSSVCLFRYFIFSLCLQLLLPSLRLLHRQLFLILTHGAHGSHALTRRREWLIYRKEM